MTVTMMSDILKVSVDGFSQHKGFEENLVKSMIGSTDKRKSYIVLTREKAYENQRKVIIRNLQEYSEMVDEAGP